MLARKPEVRRDSRLFADLSAEILERGHEVEFVAQGESMTPNLRDGDVVRISPAGAKTLRGGEIALVENADGLRLHRVTSAGDGIVTRGDAGLEADPAATKVYGRMSQYSRGSSVRGASEFQRKLGHPLGAWLRRIYIAAARRFPGLFSSALGALMVLGAVSLLAPAANAQADLTMTQTVSTQAVALNTNYTYAEVVTNNGPNSVPAGTIVVYQQTPPNTNFRSITGTNWTCTTPTSGNSGPITCTYNNALASGATAPTITITMRINAGTAYGTTILNSATVTSQTADPVPSNNTSVTSLLAEPTNASDMAVSMTAAPTPVFVYSSLGYNVVVQNLGQQTLASGTTNALSVVLPAGVTFVSSVAPAGWSCTGTTTVNCSTTATMAKNTSASFTINVTAPSTATTLTATATVTVSGDPNALNNTAAVVTVVQPIVCATPGKDGAAPTFSTSTIVNTYFPPAAAGALAAGSTTVTIGAAAASGAQTPIAIGDLLLIIQMQDAAINSTNTSSYGDGAAGDPANGATALNNSGNFEFVTAARNVGVAGGVLIFKGSGAGGGLLNTYTSAAYVAGTQGQRTYQIIRVPQYTNVTLSSNLTAMAWNGATGGVLAIDAASQLTLGGTVSVDSMGFRGGGGRILNGATGNNTDYLTLATVATNGSKGEGIAGTPRYLAPLTYTQTATATDTGVEGLPNGSYARGGPGNAGGGGTDGDPANNDENSGGGAGGNGGSGGYGGYGWNTFAAVNSTNGGVGGDAFPATTSSIVLGGGGGAGTTNNGSYFNSTTDQNNGCGASCTGIYSSGGAGGGIIVIHAGTVVGTGTLSANGQGTLSTQNDSTGGGGAGGSIILYANTGTLSGLTVSAIGGNAGNAWPTQAPGAFSGGRHGPGGGGAGGVVLLSGTPAAVNVSGGSNGYTNTAQDSYGATPGGSGINDATHIITETPGTQAGAYCVSADLSVTNVASPVIVAAGGTISYTQVATNNGSFDSLNVTFSEPIPANTTFSSISVPAGWTCTTPAVGGTGNISCTIADLGAGASSTFTVNVAVLAGVTTGTQIISVDNITSGTTDPNLANNSATATTTVGAAGSADLSLTNTASAPTVVAGSNVTMTAVAKNLGTAAATGTVTFTEAIPANTTFVSMATPSGWTCFTPAAGGTGNIYCSTSTLAVNATATFPVVLKVTAGTAAGTTILAEGTVGSSVPDPNPSNNVADATTVVATAGQADLAVTATDSPDPVSQGNNITYTQSVTNNGPAVETNATFTDVIPTNTTFVSLVAPSGWTCTTPAVGATGTVTCTLNTGQTIAVGASVNFPLVVQVTPGTAPGTTITNTPTVTSTVGDPTSGNNSVTLTTTVASPTQADVKITKTASPEPVNQNTNLTYTLSVTNAGPAIAAGVAVTDVLPAQVTYTSVFTSQGTCTYTAATTTVSCSIGSLPVGSVAVITINVKAITFSSASGSTNTATVTATTSDPNSANNTSSSFTTIQSPTAVDIAAFHAYSQADGSILLEWRTHEESRNLGFHLYRESASGKQRINPSLIAGSALLLRGSKPQHAAKTYRWVDPQTGNAAAYWIEDVDVNGSRTMHGPVYPEAAPAATAESSIAEPRSMASPLLSEMRLSTTRHQASSISLMRPQPAPPAVGEGTPRIATADLQAVKIYVDHEGWYRVTMSQLIAAGFEAGGDPRTLHLVSEGYEQPILYTNNGRSDISPTDTIEFYGTGIDTPYSGERAYWLVRQNQSGKRIRTQTGSASGRTAGNAFPFSVIREDRTTYFAALLNGEDKDNFFGAVVTSDPVDQELNVAHIASASDVPVTLDLAIQGGTDQQDHRINVDFNGSNIGVVEFSGLALFKQTFPVDASMLRDGANTVTLTALNGDNDVSVVQSIELHYAHTYAADANWLRATAAAGTDVNISGFTSGAIRAFDITDPLNISELRAEVTTSAGMYSAKVTTGSSGPAERTILAFSDDTVSGPTSLSRHIPLDASERRTGGDIVVITHPDFADAMAPLVQFRETQGHRVVVVTTDQLYDAYNNGERSPVAIQAYLGDAMSKWQWKPQSVLLVGDASFDPRSYLGLGGFDFVPTRLVETAAFKTASDDWFSDFGQTGFGTIPTGRLPVRTAADASLLVSKIIHYERGTYGGSWNSQALIIGDQNVDANFSSAVAASATAMPSSLNVSQILADGMDPDAARTQILGALNKGALLLDYHGHGSEQQWSFSNLFNSDDAATLSNGGKLPMYLLMDCLNGFFQDVYAESLAESVLLAPNGGAVAVWASSGFTDQAPQVSMNQALLNQLSLNPKDSIGRLILRAKSNVTDKDVRRTWILFGDPAMKLQIPTTPGSGTHPGASPFPPPQKPVKPCVREFSCIKEKSTL